MPLPETEIIEPVGAPEPHQVTGVRKPIVDMVLHLPQGAVAHTEVAQQIEIHLATEAKEEAPGVINPLAGQFHEPVITTGHQVPGEVLAPIGAVPPVEVLEAVGPTEALEVLQEVLEAIEVVVPVEALEVVAATEALEAPADRQGYPGLLQEDVVVSTNPRKFIVKTKSEK